MEAAVKGEARGRENSLPQKLKKKCFRKMVSFPKALFLVTNFPKIVKNSIFLLKFYQKLSKFSQNFPTICVFRPNALNINGGFVKFFKTLAKIMRFSQFS